MKTLLIIVPIIILLVSFWIISRTDWHTNRNQYNQLPTGNLALVKDKKYVDEDGLNWELQPQIKNKFHQPDEKVAMVENPYPNIDSSLKFDPDNPNLKFLSKTANNGSYEAILQPDGTYLTSGLKQGTYNYSHPGGFWGSLKHAFLDVFPHFFNAKYK